MDPLNEVYIILSFLHSHFHTSAYGAHITYISYRIHGYVKNTKIVISCLRDVGTIIWCSWGWLIYKVSNENKAHVYNVWKQICVPESRYFPQ